MSKNYSITQALDKLIPILENLPYNERLQLSSLVSDFGYQGAMTYLDPNYVARPPSERDQVMVERHYNILKEL